MSDRYIIKKDHLAPLLRRLSKEYRLVAPVENEYGDTLFSVVDSLDNTVIDLAHQAQMSIKPFLFPQREVLFSYKTFPSYTFAPLNTSRPTVYFGLRSCDVSAILYMDVIFQNDPFYRKKRMQSVLISLGCNDPFANCFCLASRSGPFLEVGFDLQLTDLGNRYFVDAGRARGREIIKQWGSFFEPATKDDIKAQYQAFLESRGNFKHNVPMDQAIRQLQTGNVSDDIYRKLSSLCQDCGGCAYICPTCTCFSIVDQPITDTQGERIRSWDACTFAGFTQMAGGHNPVDHKHHCIKRRFEHKLLHDVKKHKRPSCIGCGRCVDMCFGNVDILRFIAMVCEEQEEKQRDQ